MVLLGVYKIKRTIIMFKNTMQDHDSYRHLFWGGYFCGDTWHEVTNQIFLLHQYVDACRFRLITQETKLTELNSLKLDVLNAMS
jgi:hypothetical protein